MSKSNFLNVLMIFASVILSLSSCVIEDTAEPEDNENPSVIELSVSNLTSGYFELTWDEVDDAAWYFVKIEKDGVAISDHYNGTVGLQNGLITNGVAEIDVSGSVKNDETYAITVTATDYLIGGVTKAVGKINVTMPALPSEIIATWNSTSTIGDNWTFNADGTITTNDTGASYTMTWTIEKTQFVIRKHFSTNDQIDRYNYVISEDGNTLTLTRFEIDYILTKSTKK